MGGGKDRDGKEIVFVIKSEENSNDFDKRMLLMRPLTREFEHSPKETKQRNELNLG